MCSLFNDTPPPTDDDKWLSVSGLTAKIRGVLEQDFRGVPVEGEISNLTRAASGHLYFSLKDDGALLGAVMWRSSATRLKFTPREGLLVRCRGDVTVYDKRGQYQLLVKSMEPAGEGALWARFQKLKEQLEREGLFAEDRKRPLPRLPRKIGVVTSPTGAAIRDILTVMERRAPSVSVLIYPCRVQGDGAGAEVARAVERLGCSGKVETILVGRGGGSLEDLWEFNDEALARAIAACPVPVVSAVGHEVDFTIADFAADLRAPTPSAGAELLTAGYTDLREGILDDLQRIERHIRMALREMEQRFHSLLNSHNLRRPEMRLREAQQRVDQALEQLPRIMNQRLERNRLKLQRLTGSLEGHNPTLILKKGYAIVRREKDGRVYMDASKLKNNMKLQLEMRDGSRGAIVSDDAADDLFG